MADIIINDDNIRWSYTFTGFSDYGANLRLDSFSAINIDQNILPNQNDSKAKVTGNRYIRNYNNTTIKIYLVNGENNLEIKISRPSSMNYEPFKLEGEKKLESYLSNIEFPLAIIDVYNKLIELLKIDVKDYKVFEIICKKGFPREEIVTDHIRFEKGNLDLVRITENNKTVTYYIKGNYWTYNAAGLSITKHLDETYHYAINDVTEAEISSRQFNNDLATAENDVEAVKKLTKSLIEPNNL